MNIRYITRRLELLHVYFILCFGKNDFSIPFQEVLAKVLHPIFIVVGDEH